MLSAVANTIAPFIYDRLQPGEIRLLHNKVGNDGVTLWSLETVRLHHPERLDALEFDALSYTWGDPAETFPFVCNSHEFRIHRNLHEALPYLAGRRSPRPIWIDALCINQSDEEEKLAQVRLMHRVYRQATKVVVWLGCASKHTETAIALLPRLAEACCEVEHAIQSMNYHDTSNGHRFTLEDYGLPELSSPTWPAIYDIVCNRWFSRLWIIQEFALAREVQFIHGPYEIDSKTLEQAVATGHCIPSLCDARGQSPRIRRRMHSTLLFSIKQITEDLEDVDVTEGFEVSIPRHFITAVYGMTGFYDCSDPRDRVWGILGFLNGPQRNELRTDNGMSLVEMYTSLAHYILTKSDQSDIIWWRFLDRATLPGKTPGLPSWCPDFQLHIQHEHETSSTAISTKGEPRYRASRSCRIVQPGGSLGEIVLRGTAFDVLTKVYPPAPLPDDSVISSDDQNHGCRIFQSWLDIREWDDLVSMAVVGPSDSSVACQTIQPMGIESNASLDRYWRTLIGNDTRYGRYKLTSESFFDFRTALKRFSSLADKNGGVVRRYMPRACQCVIKQEY